MQEAAMVAELTRRTRYGSARVGPDLTQAQSFAINERLPDLPGRRSVAARDQDLPRPDDFWTRPGYVGPLNEASSKGSSLAGYQPNE